MKQHVVQRYFCTLFQVTVNNCIFQIPRLVMAFRIGATAAAAFVFFSSKDLARLGEAACCSAFPAECLSDLSRPAGLVRISANDEEWLHAGLKGKPSKHNFNEFASINPRAKLHFSPNDFHGITPDWLSTHFNYFGVFETLVPFASLWFHILIICRQNAFHNGASWHDVIKSTHRV